MRKFSIPCLFASVVVASNKTYRGNAITQDGQVSFAAGASGGSSYTYVAGECYDEALNPTTYWAKDGTAWIQANNQTATNWTGGNPGQNDINKKYSHVNWFYDIYDAYYNGSISIKLTPPSGAPCEAVETQAQPYGYFRVGQMKRSDGRYSRSDYDDNPFYFRLGRFNGNEGLCQFTSKKMFASLESSNNGLGANKVWTLTATKNGQSYDLAGSLTSALANRNNYFNVLPLATANTTLEEKCPSHFYLATMTRDDKVTMNGTIDEKNADVNWYFTDSETGWTVTGTFKGEWWNGGAKVDFSSTASAPTTTGEAKRVECKNCVDLSSDDEGDDWTFAEKHEKGIIAGSVIGGVIVLAALGIGAWFFMGWWRKRHYQATKQIDDHDAWTAEDHHADGPYKGGESTHLRAVDTAYDPARSDVNLAEGFEYKDPQREAFTPLK